MRKFNLLILIAMLFSSVFLSKHFSQDLEKIGETKPLEINGSFSVFGSYYKVNGIDPRRNDFSWYFTGNPLLKIYGVEIPISFTVSEQERSFRQPFNQFCLSPSYKWAKAHLGYTNITWSPFTWSGQTALGAGIEINPGKFRFGLLYGRLNRAIEEDLMSTEQLSPAYKRIGYTMRVGFGTETSHVDLIALKGKDDENSLIKIPQSTTVLPGENAVVGISSKIKFSDKLFWDADIASSFYTRDLRSTELSDGDNLVFSKFKFLLQANTSTQIYNAYQTEFRFEEKLFKVKAKYRRVEPDYQSMGAYYFQTDVENITLEPSAYLLKRKLRVSASFGKQQDNVLNKKAYTTKRAIGNIGLDWNITNTFGCNANYANYSGEQGAGLKIPNQATQQSYVSQNILFSPRLTFVKEKITHFHVLMANRQWMTDRNPNTSALIDYQVDNLNHTSSFVFNKSGLTCSASYLLSIFNSNVNNNKINGIGLNLSMPFLKNKLVLVFTANGSQQKINDELFANILNISFQNNLKINDKHGITLQANYIDNSAKTDTGITFKEYNIDLGYTYSF